MTRGIHQVRQAIKQRKKKRGQNFPETTNYPYPLVQEEEKHGFQPSVYNDVRKNKQKNKPLRSNMTVKVFICFILFISTAFVLSNDDARMQPAKNWLSAQLQEEFPFAKAKEWYETTFGGTPLSIAPQGSVHSIESGDFLLPVMGQVVETFQTNGTGITISPEQHTSVTSLDDGIVIFAGNNQETKKTITIQHADGSNTTYGHLSAVDVHVYQHVQANQRIGTFSPTEENEAVFFSIEKNNQYIDPAQVIPVDDLP